MKKLEKDIEKKLKDEIKKLGGLCYKFVSPGNSGVPDRIIILPNGHVIFVELKTKSGVVKPLQKRQIKKLKNVSQHVEVLRGMDEVLNFIKDCKALVGDD